MGRRALPSRHLRRRCWRRPSIVAFVLRAAEAAAADTVAVVWGPAAATAEEGSRKLELQLRVRQWGCEWNPMGGRERGTSRPPHRRLVTTLVRWRDTSWWRLQRALSLDASGSSNRPAGARVARGVRTACAGCARERENEATRLGGTCARVAGARSPRHPRSAHAWRPSGAIRGDGWAVRAVRQDGPSALDEDESSME